jgi:excisionase family DNA binding protein
MTALSNLPPAASSPRQTAAPRHRSKQRRVSMDAPDLITTRELSQRLRMVAPTIYHLARSGTIPCVRIGGRIRFDWGVVSQLFFPGRGGKTTVPPPSPSAKGAARLEIETATPPAEEVKTRLAVPDEEEITPSASPRQVPAALDLDPTAPARRAGRPKVRHAILSPGDLSSSQVAAALQMSAALHLQPMVVSAGGVAQAAGLELGPSLVFLSVEHIQQAGASATLSHLLALASARPAKVLIAVLVSSPAMLSGLEAMPPGLPVILCPLYHMEASQEVLATALTHLVFSKD